MAKNFRSNAYEGGLTVDPSLAPGVPAPIGSIFLRVGTGELWEKIEAADTSWAIVAQTSPVYTDPPTINTIYVRTTGSDATGNGTLATPYRTFQRAIRDVPSVIPAARRYIVDVTDLGTEIFTPGYVMPPIHGPGVDQNVDGAVHPWFRFRGAVSIFATPKFPYGALSAADATITVADILTLDQQNATDRLYLLTLNVARPAWAANAVRGAIFRATNTAANQGQGDAVVVESTATTLLLTLSKGQVAGLFPALAPYTLYEQSATFEGIGSPTGGFGEAAFNVLNCDAFAISGIRFRNTVGPAGICLLVRQPGSIFAFQYCDFAQGILAVQGAQAYNPIFDACYLHGGSAYVFHGVGASMRKCFFSGVVSWAGIPDVGYLQLNQGVWESGVSLGDFKPFLGFQNSPANQGGGSLSLWMRLFRVRTPAAGAVGIGILASAGGTIENTTVYDCTVAAIRADKARGPLRLTNVQGGANGTGDSFTFAAGIVTLTDAPGVFTTDMIGKSIVIAGATSPGNDGTFVILSVPSPTTLTYANAAGVTEAFGAGTTWRAVFNTGIGLVVANTSVVNVDALTRVTGSGGDYKVGGNAATATGTGWAPLTSETDLALGDPLTQICRLYK